VVLILSQMNPIHTSSPFLNSGAMPQLHINPAVGSTPLNNLWISNFLPGEWNMYFEMTKYSEGKLYLWEKKCWMLKIKQHGLHYFSLSIGITNKNNFVGTKEHKHRKRYKKKGDKHTKAEKVLAPCLQSVQ